MGIIIPADHVREGVVTVALREALVMFDKEIPVRQRDISEVCSLQHPFAPGSKSMGTCCDIGLNPRVL